MAGVAFVQSVTFDVNGSSGIAPQLIGVAAGNFLTLINNVFVSSGNPPNNTPSDGVNTWNTTTAPSPLLSTNALICYAPNVAAGSPTVSQNYGVTFATSGALVEFSGVKTTSPLGPETSNNGTSTTPTSGTTATTTTNNGLVLACCADGTPVNPIGIDTPATVGYSNLITEQNNVSAQAGSCDYLVLTAAGTQSAAWGTLNGSDSWIAKIATFQGVDASSVNPGMALTSSMHPGRSPGRMTERFSYQTWASPAVSAVTIVDEDSQQPPTAAPPAQPQPRFYEDEQLSFIYFEENERGPLASWSWPAPGTFFEDEVWPTPVVAPALDDDERPPFLPAQRAWPSGTVAEDELLSFIYFEDIDAPMPRPIPAYPWVRPISEDEALPLLLLEEDVIVPARTWAQTGVQQPFYEEDSFAPTVVSFTLEDDSFQPMPVAGPRIAQATFFEDEVLPAFILFDDSDAPPLRPIPWLFVQQPIAEDETLPAPVVGFVDEESYIAPSWINPWNAPLAQQPIAEDEMWSSEPQPPTTSPLDPGARWPPLGRKRIKYWEDEARIVNEYLDKLEAAAARARAVEIGLAARAAHEEVADDPAAALAATAAIVAESNITKRVRARMDQLERDAKRALEELRERDDEEALAAILARLH